MNSVKPVLTVEIHKLIELRKGGVIYRIGGAKARRNLGIEVNSVMRARVLLKQ